MSEKTTTMDTIHSGQIILTNKRLLVMDENGSTAQVMYSNITNVIPYSDALGIMKSRGKDVYLIGNIDYEEVAIILIRLMTNDLAAHRKIAENVSEREPDSTAKDTSNLIDEKTSIDPKRKLTPHDLLTFIKIIDPKVDLRLDKNQHFFYDNSDELTLQDLKEAFTSAPTDAMNQLQPILSHSLKLSKTLAQKLGNTDYVFRYYFGKNFDTLICQCRDGKIEYYILNDPKFLNS